MASYHDSNALSRPCTTETVTVVVTLPRVRSHSNVPRHCSSCPPAAYKVSVGGDRSATLIRRASACETPIHEISAPVSGVQRDVPVPWL